MLYGNIIIMNADIIADITSIGDVKSLTLTCEKEIPAWSLAHYCRETISNGVKLTILHNMYNLLFKKYFDFAIKPHTKELNPIISGGNYSKNTDFNEKDLIRLEYFPFDFWYNIKYFVIPDVLVKVDGKWLPIYQQHYRTAIVLKEVSVESPPLFNFQGLGEVIENIRFGADRENRNKIDWENKQIKNSLDNSEQFIKVSKMLNDPNIPDGCKYYLKDLYLSTLKKQFEVNNSIGITTKKIDIVN